jgi:hypothetical protein
MLTVYAGSLVGDCVLRDPKITFSENPHDVETRGFA